MEDCKTCVHDGCQCLFPSGCTGCGDGEYLNYQPTSQKQIMDAIEIIARLKPVPVEPCSFGLIGGIKVISNPLLDSNTIVVSDDIHSILSNLSSYQKNNQNKA